MAERQTQKRSIDVGQVLNYLNHAFSRATQKASPFIGTKNNKGTPLYHYQVDFCYLVDGIQRGPRYIVPKLITKANELIDEINNISEKLEGKEGS